MGFKKANLNIKSVLDVGELIRRYKASEISYKDVDDLYDQEKLSPCDFGKFIEATMADFVWEIQPVGPLIEFIKAQTETENSNELL